MGTFKGGDLLEKLGHWEQDLRFEMRKRAQAHALFILFLFTAGVR